MNFFASFRLLTFLWFLYFYPLATLFLLSCPVILVQCGSGRSVAPIKAGFVARVGRRNAGT